MSKKNVLYGKTKIINNDEAVNGEYINIDGEKYYKISNYNEMTSFFMSIVSSSDHWMFISSNGGLTAGRKDPDNALFPYYTDDKIHESHDITGSKTIMQVHKDDDIIVWEPFSESLEKFYTINRNIYKNISGNKIIFEEDNSDLKLKFSYSWLSSEKYGFVKKARLLNYGDSEVKIKFLDGIQNLLPYGLYQQFQIELSTFADGFKRNELIEEKGIGLFTLSSIPCDKAEPSEALRTTIAWSCGIEADNYLLSSQQINAFRTGKTIITENDIKGRRGAYFISAGINLKASDVEEWLIVADINIDLKGLAKIEKQFDNKNNLYKNIIEDVEIGTNNLNEIVARADGLQLGTDELITSRHYSNVLFNTMRGGIFNDSYNIDKNDYIKFLSANNHNIIHEVKAFLESLDEKISYFDLQNKVEELSNNELKRLTLEYLPITFSRRHGDPSRPWNRFSIDIKNEKNEKILNYQGNWRDLFQNWEALSYSYPEYLKGMIVKFLNASTADGYNPYRVIRDGFDWEIPEPDKPWSHIGYWGDHQIIYLLKLLEQQHNFNPTEIYSWLNDELFTYANVPYRIANYRDLIKDPHNTIKYDYEKQKKIDAKEQKLGVNAKYLYDSNDNLIKVNLTEKLLIPLLTKLSNFIPGAGIWLNTQRPEWNDANNALVGYGVSMVTLYYMRRYVTFCVELLSKVKSDSVQITSEVKVFLNEIASAFENNKAILDSNSINKERKQILDLLGTAGENFRNTAYDNKISLNKEYIEYSFILEFLALVNKFIDYTIALNKREDGLYHAYNLISIREEEIEVTNLYEMLEGQVAVISSGFLSPHEVVDVVEALRKSSLYREDQNSYILYPNRELPRFIEKNILSQEIIEVSELLVELVQDCNNDVIIKDDNDEYHFNGDIRNSKVLEEKLAKVSLEYDVTETEKKKILSIYEDHFNHQAFTGRSGTFYKYEGLGSIYWHMVSKLVLAVQENYYWAIGQGADENVLLELQEYYNEINEGIGVHKSPEIYGAFPTDPYSHTPIFSGVQQPGMTGQVKEDIISRFGELGVTIRDGQIFINPSLFKTNEFLSEPKEFNYYDVNGKERKIQIDSGSFAFTLCQVPFIYSVSDTDRLTISYEDKTEDIKEVLKLDKEVCKSIFMRKGMVNKVIVEFPLKHNKA